MNTTDQPKSMENPKDSTTKLLVAMPDDTSLGEIKIEGKKVITTGITPQNQEFLYNLMRDAWRLQAGIPSFVKENGEIKRDTAGKMIVAKYLNFDNSTPDDILAAFAEYTNVLGCFKVDIRGL